MDSLSPTAHQGTVKNMAKCEFVLGVALLMGSSSFMLIPSEADLQSPLAPEIERYLATDTATAQERVQLFRLAWDVACSAFGGRQVLYERFFAGDPLSRSRFLNAIYPKEAVMERIRDFLSEKGP